MPTGSLPSRKRRPHRRDEILRAAAQLFHQRGYEATGIDDIGAAVGITGPGVYRHFASKQDILESLLAARGQLVLEQVQAIVARAEPPAAVVAALVQHYGDTLANHPSEAVVAMYERRTLPVSTRTTIDALERRNLESWVAALERARPELAPAEARALVLAALSLGVAVANYESGLPPEAVASLVASMVATTLAGDAPRRTRKDAPTRRATRSSSVRPAS